MSNKQTEGWVKVIHRTKKNLNADCILHYPRKKEKQKNNPHIEELRKYIKNNYDGNIE